MFLKGKHKSLHTLLPFHSVMSPEWRPCGSGDVPRPIPWCPAASGPGSPFLPAGHLYAQPNRPSYLETDSRRFSCSIEGQAMIWTSSGLNSSFNKTWNFWKTCWILFLERRKGNRITWVTENRFSLLKHEEPRMLNTTICQNKWRRRIFPGITKDM